MEEGPWECSECKVDAMVQALLTAPKIRDSTSASFLDGTRREGAFYDAKEANRLQKQMTSVRPSERKHLKKEIQKLGGSSD